MIIQSCFDTGQFFKKFLRCFVSANIKNLQTKFEKQQCGFKHSVAVATN